MIYRSIIPVAKVFALTAIGLAGCDAGLKDLGGERAKAREGELFPQFSGRTLKGEMINNSIFLDKVTLVSAWRIGCQWSMLEIPEYNKLVNSIRDPRFQIISLSPQTREELEEFYDADTTTAMGSIRVSTGSAVPYYDVLPMCTTKRFQTTDTLGPQCDALEDLIGAEAFPITFVVGPDGTIHHRHDGLIVEKKTYVPDISIFRADLDSLLRIL